MPQRKTLIKHRENINNKLLRIAFHSDSSSISRCVEAYISTMNLLNGLHNDFPQSEPFISMLLTGIHVRI